jgi:hypothetical protein
MGPRSPRRSGTGTSPFGDCPRMIDRLLAVR